MKKLLIVFVFLIWGCDKRIDIPLNGNDGKLITTDCGIIRLTFDTMGGTFILSCFISVYSPTQVFADHLKVLVNDKTITYNLWVNNKRANSSNFEVEKNIRLDYSFVVPREFGSKLEFKIFAIEQFLQQQEGSVNCGFSPIVKIVNR